ncbi:mitochondrial carrier domain-containing protein [Biscogniauxia marginata]|nr:mitochondrial carrier domain-containing protein [Biscogniauxia marginata]
MSADFWAGYISGAVGILIGNPLDLIKVRLQASKETTTSSTSSSSTSTSPTSTRRPPYFPSRSALVAGTAAPVFGYGALNALLFVSYNRTEALLNESLGLPPHESGAGSGSNLWTTWIAGAVGGLATWAVSTPTELVKCRAQVLASSSLTHSSSSSLPAPGSGPSSWAIAKHVLRTEGVRGLYLGGAVTALRDSIGYGFYFWSYELGCRWVEEYQSQSRSPIGRQQQQQAGFSDSFFSLDAARVLLCGGVAGVVTWASVFPLDVVKTRVQTQSQPPVLDVAAATASTPLLGSRSSAERGRGRLDAMEIAREAYRESGTRVFFRGLTVCSVRAFIVNAVQWAAYEWIMFELGQGRRAGANATGSDTTSSSIREKEPI